VRCLSFASPELLNWLRSQLRTAVSITAFASDADEDGLALLAEPFAQLLARDGRGRLVVPSARAATAASRALSPGGAGLTIDVVPEPPDANVYVLLDNDGTYRAYLGTASLTLAGLTTGAPGVVLDTRQDDDDARALLEELTATASKALAATASVRLLEDLMQPVMDDLAGKEGAAKPPAGTMPTSAGVPGLRTGIGDLDHLTGGLQPGDLWVVTGRSGAGKSVLALGFARNAAIRSRVRTALLSGRGSAVDTAMILLSAEARVPLHFLRHGGLKDGDLARLARRMGEIADAPLVLHASERADVAGPLTVSQRIAAARDVSAGHDLRLLVVDDLPATVAVEELLQLKALAINADACVVAVVDEDAVLPLTNAERAAALAADVVLRVDRDHDMTPGADSHRAGEADLRVLRHRRGPIAIIPMAFQGYYGRFTEMLASDVLGGAGGGQPA
jgi:replicative DNA helicase